LVQSCCSDEGKCPKSCFDNFLALGDAAITGIRALCDCQREKSRRQPGEMLPAVLLSLLFVTWRHLASANPDAKRLYDDLLRKKKYNRLMRPVADHGHNLTVKIDLKLSQLIDVVSIMFLSFSCFLMFYVGLGSRMVSVLDSGAEGPGFKSQPRR